VRVVCKALSNIGLMDNSQSVYTIVLHQTNPEIFMILGTWSCIWKGNSTGDSKVTFVVFKSNYHLLLPV